MSETLTELTVNVYAGVPFNTKYQNVLFVDRQARDLFLQTYEVGSEIKVSRFDIINDTQAIIDISNDYGTMSVNYLKIHRKLCPQSVNTIYEYDLFYFVNHTQQLATNVVRLTLELDIFQTYFVKYNYQTESYEIPVLKNSRCEISTDFENDTQCNSLTEPTFFQLPTIATPLFNFESAQYGPECHIVICFTSDKSQHVAISKLSYYCMGKVSQGSMAGYDFNTIIDECIGQSYQMYFATSAGSGVTAHNINVTNVYILPKQYVTNYVSNFSNLATSYYKFHMGGSIGDINIEFYMTNGGGSQLILPYVQYIVEETFDHENVVDQYSVGTFSKQIELPFTNGTTYIEIQLTFGTTFKIILMCNNQIIDVTDEFEYSILESAYAQYMQQHQNGLAIKSIASIIGVTTGVGELAAGNPAGIISASSSLTNMANEIAGFVDLKKQPLKTTATPAVQNAIGILNGIGMFISEPSNADEIRKNRKYYGFKMNYLTSKTFNFMPTETDRNFDFYKFTNVEIVGKVQESFKSRFEQMFLNGVRFWYTTTKFLETIENTETQGT